MFTLVGVIPKKATLAFDLRVHGEDGSAREQTSHDPKQPMGAQLVYAGTPLPDDQAPSNEKAAGPAIPLAVIIGTIGAGVAILLFKMRRADSPDAVRIGEGEGP